MTLLELCEPICQYVCRLSRSGRKGAQPQFSVVRSDIENILGEIRKAATDPYMAEQFAKVELPLIFFIDSILSESDLPLAAQWNENRLAAEKHELAGDEKFFDLLDETLADGSEAATERLTIFYTCIGLGFTGWYKGQTDHLQKKMTEIAARIRGYLKTETQDRICPEAYEHLDTRNLIEPPSQKLIGIAIALVGLILSLLMTNMYLYSQASTDLLRALERIVDHERGMRDVATAVSDAQAEDAEEE